MGLFDRLKEPVFLKESSNIVEQIEKLKALEPLLILMQERPGQSFLANILRSRRNQGN